MRRMAFIVLALSTILGCAAPSQGDAKPAAKATPAKVKASLPGITINKAERYVDVQAQIVLREGLLELVACIDGTKEHESIAALKAKAQHVHLAMLMLGAKPGKPTQWVKQKNREFKRILPTGERFRVTFVFNEGGRKVERSITQYVVNGKGKAATSDVFLFAGSKMTRTPDGRSIYEADESGDAISLVSFGDELLVWPNPAESDYSTLDWYANTKALPEVGTKLLVRLRWLDGPPRNKPATKATSDKSAATQPADKPAR